MKSAAEALHVSPAAVSQQVAKLEEAIGAELFERHARRLKLTDAGQRYLQAIQPALAQISQATQALQSDTEKDIVRITCTASFATQWFDFAIRHSLGRHPGLNVQTLLDDPLMPVCSPGLLAGAAPVSVQRDLQRFTLLHDEQRSDWALWLSTVDAAHVDALRGPVFVDCNGAVQAALAGLGLALVRPSLVRAEIADGRLVAPFGMSVKAPFGYHLIEAAGRRVRRGPARFRHWLLAEATTPYAPLTPRPAVHRRTSTP